jgi:hypothetical protein
MDDTHFEIKNQKKIDRPKYTICPICTPKMWCTSQKFFLKCPICMHFQVDNVSRVCYSYTIES